MLSKKSKIFIKITHKQLFVDVQKIVVNDKTDVFMNVHAIILYCSC